MGDDYQKSHVRTLLSLVLVGLLAFGVVLTMVGNPFGSSDELKAYSEALGASIIGSVLLYWLINVLAEPQRTKLQARESTEEAVRIAQAHFNKYFERSLPEQVFAVSDIPRADFRKAFVEMLTGSASYEMKGTSGKFTTYRLCRLQNRPEVQRLETVSLVLLDPREDQLLAANVDFRSKKPAAAEKSLAQENLTDNFDKEVKKLRGEVYETLVALFDIRKERPTRVYFHKDLPYYRTEHFDRGLLLTYYVGERDFHETLLYRSAARPFDAYTAALKMTRNFASAGSLSFDGSPFATGAIKDDDDLRRALTELGCQDSVPQLRRRLEERNAELDRKLATAGLSSDELF